MAYSPITIQTLRNDIIANLHGTTANQIQGVATGNYGLFNRAASQLLLDLDPYETKRQVITTTPIFTNVWDYALPSDCKGNAIVDIAPQVNRYPNDITIQNDNQTFDRMKAWGRGASNFTVTYNSGVKALRIRNNQLPIGTTLDPMNTIGNWTVGGSATNLTVTNQVVAYNSGALQFNISAGAPGTVGSLSETIGTSINVAANLNQAYQFLYVYLLNPSHVTNIILRWGSDASDYYQQTATTNFSNNAFNIGWNLIGVPWLGATVVGTPNPAAINYLYAGVTTDGTALTAVAMDTFTSVLGQYMNLNYYSDCLFTQASSGGFNEVATADNDTVNLGQETRIIFTNLCTMMAAQQIQDPQTGVDVKTFGGAYAQGVAAYRSIYKSDRQKLSQSYYTKKNHGWGKYIGLGRYSN